MGETQSGKGGGEYTGQNNMGVSPFDMQAVMDAAGLNEQATQNRYAQLGLGGSTMEGQDVAQDALAGQAAIGQLQTQNENTPALNPALQTAGTTGGSTLSSTLSGPLSSLVNSGTSLGKASVTGGT